MEGKGEVPGSRNQGCLAVGMSARICDGATRVSGWLFGSIGQPMSTEVTINRTANGHRGYMTSAA